MLSNRVRRLSNRSSPINSLPTELLVAIFKHIIAGTRIPLLLPSSDSASGRERRLFQCTHVCFLWRDIILNAPELWTYVSNGSRMTELFMQRSHPLSVKLKFDCLYHDDMPACVKILKRHGHRLRRLDLRVFTHYTESFQDYKQLISFDAPSL